MALSTVLLKKAIYEKISNDSTLADYVGDTENNELFDETDLRIYENGPEFPSDNGASIVYDITNTSPLIQTTTPIKCFTSTVLLYACGSSSDRAANLGDELEDRLFPDSSTVGYWDLTNTDITNKGTRFERRMNNLFNSKTDTWYDMIEIEVKWCAFNCNADETASTKPTEPTPEYDDLEYDCPDCDS